MCGFLILLANFSSSSSSTSADYPRNPQTESLLQVWETLPYLVDSVSVIKRTTHGPAPLIQEFLLSFDKTVAIILVLHDFDLSILKPLISQNLVIQYVLWFLSIPISQLCFPEQQHLNFSCFLLLLVLFGLPEMGTIFLYYQKNLGIPDKNYSARK